MNYIQQDLLGNAGLCQQLGFTTSCKSHQPAARSGPVGNMVCRRAAVFARVSGDFPTT